MARTPYPSEKLDQYMLRFPDGMREQLKQSAADNGRTLNAEIVYRLERSLAGADQEEVLELLRHQNRMITALIEFQEVPLPD